MQLTNIIELIMKVIWITLFFIIFVTLTSYYYKEIFDFISPTINYLFSDFKY